MERRQFETEAIRTQSRKTYQREHSTPLFLTSSFTFESAEQGGEIFKGQLDANLYSRFSNPNTDELIEKLCLLEETEFGVATSSGMAAVYTTFASLLKSGDHVIASKAIFGNSQYIFKELLPRWNIHTTFVDISDHHAYENAVQDNTKILFIESPSNPTLDIADLSFLNTLCAKNDIIFCVDNCFATPYLQKPVRFGADIVLHSATKYIDGQGRVLGGAILGKKEYVAHCYDFVRRTGACLSPFNAWVLSKSLETLGLRMDRHCANALVVAEYLNNHPDVIATSYPHLNTHPHYELAKAQMKKGGGLVGCELKGGKERASRFLNALTLHSLTANLGDSRSIATHPASTTHAKLSAAEQADAGIKPGFVRFSVGLEHIDDIIHDIDQALKNS